MADYCAKFEKNLGSTSFSRELQKGQSTHDHFITFFMPVCSYPINVDIVTSFA